MKLTTLGQCPQYFQQTLNLIEDAFNYPSDQSYAVDFYPLVCQENWDHCHILIDDNKVVAHVGVLLKKLTTDDPVAFLGGIAVDQKQRGKGYFKSLFNQVLELYQNDVAFFALWSDLDQLYQKFGFYQAGQCYQTGEQPFNAPVDYQKAELASLEDHELEQLNQLYHNQKIHTIKRSLNDWKVLAKISSSQLYILCEKGTIISYFFIGKGADLTQIIHEHACSDPQQSKKLLPYQLWQATPAANYHKSLYLGLFRAGNPDLLSRFISNYLYRSFKILSMDSSSIQFLYKDTNYQLTPNEFWPALFGPGKVEEFNSALPLYFSGLDTI